MRVHKTFKGSREVDLNTRPHPARNSKFEWQLQLQFQPAGSRQQATGNGQRAVRQPPKAQDTRQRRILFFVVGGICCSRLFSLGRHRPGSASYLGRHSRHRKLGHVARGYLLWQATLLATFACHLPLASNWQKQLGQQYQQLPQPKFKAIEMISGILWE